MAEDRAMRSFSILRLTGLDWRVKPLDEHPWPFDASDLSAMHGDYGRLSEMGGVPGLCAALRTNGKTGLYEDEVEAKDFHARISHYGKNVIEKPPMKTYWEHCMEGLEDPMLIILMIAGVVSIGLGAYEDTGSGWIEGVAILLAVFIVTNVGAANNLSQEREFRRLEDSRDENFFKVWRNGVAQNVPQSEVMVGDLVELSAGDEVPADGVFVFGDDPACNEAKMTGESKEIVKSYTKPFLLAGTELKKGQMHMLVVAVGMNTSYGRILAGLVKPPEKTPLQEKLEKVAELVGYIGGGVAVLLFLVLMIRWIARSGWDDDGEEKGTIEILEFFIIAVTIVVVAVPEGLPLAVTVSLAYSMSQMVEQNNLVRVLAACETMGNCTAICSDKTGTLTTNIMTVMRGWLCGTPYDQLDKAPKLESWVLDLLEEGVIVNSKAREEFDKSHKKVWKGNQTEVALMTWLAKHGKDVERARARILVDKNYPFDSMKKNSSIIVQRKGNKGYRRYYKGAAELLLERSTKAMNALGGVESMEKMREELSKFIDGMTRSGLRTIGFSYQDFDHIDSDPMDPTKLMDPPEDAPMVFFGVVGIKDPLREESKRSVEQCQRAGVVVRMVTGDHPATATFIAKECSILTNENHVVLTGPEFRKLVKNKPEAERIIPNLRVLARSKPEDKRILVKWLKDHKHVVAATGDGTNDAPALKEAHVGIAMDIVGTAVAKAAAEILILDDNFASIVKSVMWGRSVFDNIRKFVQFQLTVNVVALIIVLIGALADYTNPLKAVQLLWVNLIMDTMAALALGTEIPTEKLLERRPYSSSAPLISRLMWKSIFVQSIYQLIVLFIVLFAGADIFDVEEKSVHHYTIVFNSFVFMQVFNEINSRKVNNEMNVFENFFDNWIFSGILIVTCVMQAFMVELFGSFAETTGLTAFEWVFSILVGMGSIPVGFLGRLIPMDVTEGMIVIPEDTFRVSTAFKSDTNRLLNAVENSLQ